MSRALLSTFFVLTLLALTVGCAKQQPLAVGSTAPTIELHDQHGELQSRESLSDGALLVYFYPKDSTPGCTAQACAFRDVWSRYEELGVGVVGVSRDDVESHVRFAEEHQLPFPLLADTEGALAESFGLKARLGMSPRVSFLLDDAGVIRAVYTDVDPGVHADEVLADVERFGL